MGRGGAADRGGRGGSAVTAPSVEGCGAGPCGACCAGGAAVSTILRVLLGGLFVFSGVMKIMDVQQFAYAVRAFKIIGDEALIAHVAFTLPWTEVFVGTALVLGLRTRAAATLLTAMLLVFCGAIVSVIVRGIDAKCGCFGRLLGDEIGWATVGRNGVLLAVTLYVLACGSGPVSLDRLLARRPAARAGFGAE